jgi:hypothetical protein
MRLKRDLKIWALLCASFAPTDALSQPRWRLSSVDFDQGSSLEGYEADSLENNLGGTTEQEPEMSGAETRTAMKMTFGLAVGEFIPGASYGASGLLIQNDVQAIRISAANGKRSYSSQSSSGRPLVRKIQISQIDGGIERWPAAHFPFSFVLAGGVSRVAGEIKDYDGIKRSFNLGLISVGGEIVLESVFENGVWVRWTLLSGRRYFAVTRGLSNLDAESQSVVADDVTGMKITGFANITLGYAW